LASGGMEKCAKIVEKTAQMLCDLLNEIKWYWFFMEIGISCLIIGWEGNEFGLDMAWSL
jgi:uncharacterized membrane protein